MTFVYRHRYSSRQVQTNVNYQRVKLVLTANHASYLHIMEALS